MGGWKNIYFDLTRLPPPSLFCGAPQWPHPKEIARRQVNRTGAETGGRGWYTTQWVGGAQLRSGGVGKSAEVLTAPSQLHCTYVSQRPSVGQGRGQDPLPRSAGPIRQLRKHKAWLQHLAPSPGTRHQFPRASSPRTHNP